MIATGAPGVVRRWVRMYTGGLPAELRDRRREEIDGDLWSQLEEARVTGRPARSTNGEILSRWMAGIPADLSWRLEHRGGAPVTTQTATASEPISPGLGALAIFGGLGLGALILAFTETTTEPAVYNVGVLGELALAAWLAALVLNFQQRLSRTAVVMGSIGALGMALAVVGAWPLMLVAPACGAVLVWNLATLRILDRWVAALHVVAAVGLLGIGATYASGTNFIGVGVALIAYPASWVLIGLSLLRRSRTARPEPAPAA